MTMCRFLLPLVLLWTAYATVVDFRTYRIPAGFPRRAVFAATALCAVPTIVLRGHIGAWFLYLILFIVIIAEWRLGGIGGGDVKLWTVWWLWTPPTWIRWGLVATAVIWVVGGLARLLILRHEPGQKYPAAWQALIYGVWLSLVFLTSP